MEEITEKKEWSAPEIVELDVDKTAGGPTVNAYESSNGTIS